jgi:uncharacterized protein YbbK (DUF523 family)
MSACLCGLKTRYDGRTAPHKVLSAISARCSVIPVCPEILGGLGIPRPRCSFRGGDGAAVLAGTAGIFDDDGIDRTREFIVGAQEAVRAIVLAKPQLTIFKEGSPSCGVRRVTVDLVKSKGCGMVTALLTGLGMSILSEDDPLPQYFMQNP